MRTISKNDQERAIEESYSYFKFKKVSPLLNTGELNVPSKRSGHRAVSNESNLYIWGGYCPTNENHNNISPLYPQVKYLFNAMQSSYYFILNMHSFGDLILRLVNGSF